MTNQSDFLMFYGYFIILLVIGVVIYKRSGFLKMAIICCLLPAISFLIIQYTYEINYKMFDVIGRFDAYNPLLMAYLPLPLGFIAVFLLKKKKNKNNVNK